MSLRVPTYLAHIRQTPDGERVEQTAAAHCKTAASYAAEALRTFGLSRAAYLAALLHDLG